MNAETLISFLTALHVVVVVLWIGGVAFVTIIVFPMLLKMEDSLPTSSLREFQGSPSFT
jgi:uncharacterized membrane protein